MVILSKGNFLIFSDDRSKQYPVSSGYVGEIPEWVSKTKYFKQLVSADKIAISESKKDKDIQKAAEEEKKPKKA